MTALEEALAEEPVADAPPAPVALDAWVVAWDAEAEAEADEALVAEAELSEAEAEAEAELDASDAALEAAEVTEEAAEEAAEDAAEEPEPTLAQKVWTAGRTWSKRDIHVSIGSQDINALLERLGSTY